ncbi:antitoxin [Sphingosinicella terrae]|jgi:antitoxin VapB|uniref:antitoxin n=1 Tax=Sphingosinicella terrae TaxID=2172047 RepID=UPI000E0DB641|nr:AbrB/MazE/SpoVT family DNA-binding domain-containing protein [Sphingosinicella terrae]
MKVTHSRTFRSGNSEAVRLPKEVAFGGEVDVEIIRSGDVLTIRPRSKLTPRQLVEALEKLPKPAHVQERETIEFPERPGL